MKKILLALLLACGCTSVPKEEVLDGTIVEVGLYVPVSGQLYGLQIFRYVSGTKVFSTKTNSLDITHHHSFTNSFFGSNTGFSKQTEIK